MLQRLLLLFCSCVILTACTGQAPAATPTAVSIAKVLATVDISATPNAEQVAATRSLTSPTPRPPTATVIPTETPYVGIFIGEAQQEESYLAFTEPLFSADVVDVQPTSNVARCVRVPIDAPYITAWRSNPSVSQRMGCPIQGGFGFFGTVQVFETGVMYHYPELNAVWAIRPLIEDSTGIFDYIENPTDTSTIGIQPPTGLIVPGGILGNMWVTVEGLREEMGFARTEAQEVPLGLQRFDNGTFLLDAAAGQVYALVTDGTVLGPFLAANNEPGTVGIGTPTPVTDGATPETTEEPPVIDLDDN